MVARSRKTQLALLVAALCAAPSVVAQDTKKFELGAETNQYMATPSYPAYPTPQMIPQAPKQAPRPKPASKPIQLNATHNQVVQPPQPLQAAVQASPPPGVLPASFLGRWMVIGQRNKVEARPEFQGAIDGIFTMSNQQTWNIAGGNGGYSMSSDSGVSRVEVGNCTQTVAFIRYQHPIKNTVAQESIVMQISPDGRQFQGMQKIRIVKQGEPTPRAEVTYALMGQRQ